jgi:hypothetical protein
VVRQDKIEQPPTRLASVNATYLGEYLDRETAMARVEADKRLGAVSGGEGEAS